MIWSERGRMTIVNIALSETSMAIYTQRYIAGHNVVLNVFRLRVVT